MSQSDDLKDIKRKLDDIKDRQIVEEMRKDNEKLFGYLNEQLSYRSEPSPKIQYYAGQYKSPYMCNEILTRNEARNRFVVLFLFSIIMLIVFYFSGFNLIILSYALVAFILTYFEFYFYIKAPKDPKIERKIGKLESKFRETPYEVKDSLEGFALSCVMLSGILLFTSLTGYGCPWNNFFVKLFFIPCVFYFTKTCYRFYKFKSINK
jgi:hypothetical protein